MGIYRKYLILESNDAKRLGITVGKDLNFLKFCSKVNQVIFLE